MVLWDWILKHRSCAFGQMLSATTLTHTSRPWSTTGPCVHVAEVLWVERCTLSLQTGLPAPLLGPMPSLRGRQWSFGEESQTILLLLSQIQNPYGGFQVHPQPAHQTLFPPCHPVSSSFSSFLSHWPLLLGSLPRRLPGPPPASCRALLRSPHGSKASLTTGVILLHPQRTLLWVPAIVSS